MAVPMALNVRLSGPLSDFVAGKVGADGSFENVSEYVRDLIRRDRDRSDEEAFVRLKAELVQAFSAPDDDFKSLDAATVIARNKRLAD